MPILVRCRHSRIVDYFNKTTKYANSHAAPPSTSDILTGCVFTLCGICLSTPAGASGGCHTEAQASLPYRKGDCRQARGWLVRIVLSRIVTFRTKNLPTTIPTTNTPTSPHPLPTSSCHGSIFLATRAGGRRSQPRRPFPPGSIGSFRRLPGLWRPWAAG